MKIQKILCKIGRSDEVLEINIERDIVNILVTQDYLLNTLKFCAKFLFKVLITSVSHCQRSQVRLPSGQIQC